MLAAACAAAAGGGAGWKYALLDAASSPEVQQAAQMVQQATLEAAASLPAAASAASEWASKVAGSQDEHIMCAGPWKLALAVIGLAALSAIMCTAACCLGGWCGSGCTLLWSRRRAASQPDLARMRDLTALAVQLRTGGRRAHEVAAAELGIQVADVIAWRGHWEMAMQGPQRCRS